MCTTRREPTQAIRNVPMSDGSDDWPVRQQPSRTPRFADGRRVPPYAGTGTARGYSIRNDLRKGSGAARCCGVAQVGILLYDDVEVLDCCGPFEVFTTASRVALRRGWTTEPFHVATIAARDRTVTARGGLQLVASRSVDDHPPLDILIVPGGLQGPAEADERLIAWLTETAEKAVITASVCTGAFLLATAGLLDGREATSHWEDV